MTAPSLAIRASPATAANMPALCLRSREELRLFFEGTELVEPGVVSCPRWRPDLAEPSEVMDVMHFCGVARRT